ncbi:LptF/LptG family permease [Calothrix sp. UHCC 0171]|uniref:LptF/LptG family permease n=1 Tax=Calothrix sp. UHCC 0171 TaxID=3110245 RepID=UPI002B21A25D|nr:LptF/LptG family permease [Calothrix sp. UHCC 0171]MEA5572445.1 LptF/LptG family permease [Calothrix sp. UHCC 0171]
MDRYLISQLIPPFLFGVGLFSSISVTVDAAFDLMRKIVESGLPASTAAQVFLLRMPEFIVLAFPMSILLATLMTYSRLSSESELVALRGCGVSVYRIAITAVLMSFLVTILAFVFNDQVAPAAKYQSTQILEQALKSDKPSFKQENIFYPEYKTLRTKENGKEKKEKILSRLFYADKFDGKRMKGLTIIDRSTEGLNQIVVSESGEWNAKENIWDFYNGTSYLVGADRSYNNIFRFEHQKVELPRTPLSLAEQSRDYGEMNIAQALEQLELERLAGDEQKIRKLKVRIQQKFSVPFVCVVFGLVGSAMGTIPQRTGRGTSFGVSVMIIFTFYLFSSIASALGIAGVLSPFLAAWLPNFVGIAIGIFLLMRVAQR